MAEVSPHSLSRLCEEEGDPSAGAMALRPSLNHVTSQGIQNPESQDRSGNCKVQGKMDADRKSVV